MRIILIAILLLIGAPAIGGEIKIAWQPNTESDLAGYYVYYGAKNRPLGARINVGRQTQYTIQNLTAGETYHIAITAFDQTGNESTFSQQTEARVAGGSEKGDGTPAQHELLPNYPNPFQIPLDKNTAIAFLLSADSPVKLEIFNVLGQRLVTLLDRSLPAGLQKIFWNGLDAQKRPVPAGIYVYRLETNGQISTRKLVIYR